MTAAAVTGRSTNPMGHVLWNTTRGDYAWFGPGSRLLMVLGSGADASLTAIEHDVANGTYDNARDARAALDRFLAEFTHDVL